MADSRVVCDAWNPWQLKQAGRVIRRGGVVAYPTEAVYGLGCDPWSRAAVFRLLAAKKRPLAKGLILIGSCLEQISPFIVFPDRQTRDKVLASWPGPVTWLLPARAEVPAWVRGAHDSVAVRVTAHPGAAALCDAAGTALVSSSANPSGRPAAGTALAVRRSLGPAVDFVLAGATGPLQRPTEIRDARTGKVVRR